MSKVCSGTTEKENRNAEEKLFANCNFKLYYPPVQSSEDMTAGIKEQFKSIEKNYLGLNKEGFSKRKLKFQCHYEDHKNRAEIKKKAFIQKLKNIYKIDVKDFNEDVMDEIIMKVRLLEKAKRERKQRSTERTLTMVTRLLKEQKYKMRETKAKCLPLKTLKSLKIDENVCIARKALESDESEVTEVIWGKCPQNQREKDLGSFIESGEEEEEEEVPLTCHEINKSKKINSPKILTRKPAPCISFEKYLQCTPKQIVFKDYKKKKVYLQDLRITNVGIETIHCRYLGILVHIKGEEKFPIGVAVRDNVKLRPGLSCSTKIRLCSQDDSNEMECSIVYETRRQKKCFEYSWFFVPVVCIPARAVVKVTPLRIIFPAITWCAATGAENANALKKILKIENTGGKACSCRISGESFKPILDEAFGEEQGEEGLDIYHTKAESEFSEEARWLLNRGEFYGEYLPVEAEETAKLLVNELIENVFATFRFSKKYCIEIPPFSVQQIEVRFIPKYKGFHHEMKYVQFEECYNLEEQNIELIGDIKQIPLKIKPQVIDLKTCVINSGVYAGIFQVFNCSKGPYAVRLKIPPSLKNHAHVHPRTTIIQPFSSCDFSVRIYPRVTLSKDAPQYFDENSGIIEFPVRVHPANKNDCKLDHIKLYVHALITTFDLELSPSVINFGTVTTVETVRTKVELTNHSLALQEYGFLNLPKGTRVEPNMGFGRILPKETISLHLIYSPVADLCKRGSGKEEIEFDVVVTSIAKYGGFKEKLEPEEFLDELVPAWMDKEYGGESPDLMQEFFDGNLEEAQPHEESEESDLCDEDFSVDGEELMSKLRFQENKIRKYLKSEDDEISGNSLYKMNEGSKKDSEQSRDRFCVIGEYEEDDKFKVIRPNMNKIKCRANVVGPRCQISETVIQLPATPFNSFSLYRFQLSGLTGATDTNCTCGLRSATKSYEGKPKFKAAFEFLHSCPQIKLEPSSGFITAGDSLPVTIVSRPELSSDELRQEPKIKKPLDISKYRPNKKESFISKSNTGIKELNQKKHYDATAKGNRKSDEMSEGTVEELTNASLVQLEKSDSFMGDKSVQETLECFFFETKIRCVIKTLPSQDESEITEIHDMVLICPAIKNHFDYLGRSQEINFGKVFIGTRSQIIFQVRNNSFERIFPSVTFLNPAGPFFCPASFCKVEIDPEHIWRQSLTFAPEEMKEVDQFFEIFFGPTCVLLKVTGEAVEPQYNILPAFGCCLLEAKTGAFEEIKLEIYNQSPVGLFLQLEAAFVKDGFDLHIEEDETEGTSETKTKQDRREESKDKRKLKNTENEKTKCRLWETTPDAILNDLENFTESSNDSVFTLIGVGENNHFVVPPYETNQIKIQFWAPADRGNKKYAVKYNLVLGRSVLLKEMVMLGRIVK